MPKKSQQITKYDSQQPKQRRRRKKVAAYLNTRSTQFMDTIVGKRHSYLYAIVYHIMWCSLAQTKATFLLHSKHIQVKLHAHRQFIGVYIVFCVLLFLFRCVLLFIFFVLRFRTKCGNERSIDF